MLAYANKYGVKDVKEREKWVVSGLIHDADWEKWPNEHPRMVIQWLKEHDADQDIINAVAAHGVEFGVEAKTRMAKTLRAVDELTGFIVAIALVKPNKSLAEVDLDSILRKWDQKAFAKGVNRAEIRQAKQKLGEPREDPIQTVLSAMRQIADKLGL